MVAVGSRLEAVDGKTVAVNRRSDGAILEGAPPAPDYPVYPSASTRGKYVEAVLTAVGW